MSINYFPFFQHDNSHLHVPSPQESSFLIPTVKEAMRFQQISYCSLNNVPGLQLKDWVSYMMQKAKMQS